MPASDILITVGAFAHLAGAGDAAETINYANADAASAAMRLLLRPGDLVAVKASRRMWLDKVVAAIHAMGESTPVVSWKIEDEYPRSATSQKFN